MFLFFLVFFLLFSPLASALTWFWLWVPCRDHSPSSFLCQHIRPVHQMLQLPAGWNPGVWEAPSERQPVLFCRKLCRRKRLELNVWYSQASVRLLAACLLYYFSVKISSYWWWHLSSGRREREREAVTVHSFTNSCANASSFLPKEVWNFTSHREQQVCLRSPLHSGNTLQEVNPVLQKAPHCSWTDIS